LRISSSSSAAFDAIAHDKATDCLIDAEVSTQADTMSNHDDTSAGHATDDEFDATPKDSVAVPSYACIDPWTNPYITAGFYMDPAYFASMADSEASLLSMYEEAKSGETGGQYEEAAWGPPEIQKLNSKAAAWTPAEPKPPLAGARKFERQLEKVLESAKIVIASCLWVASVNIGKDALGWAITIRMQAWDFPHKEDVLMLAKAALTTATGDAKSTICMLGYACEPFVVMPMGVAAKFCSVKDKKTACWGLLQQGFCRFDSACHWQHPSHQTRVAVNVMLAEPESKKAEKA
jgi:hypothetical protein